jgi:hypothetical protein
VFLCKVKGGKAIWVLKLLISVNFVKNNFLNMQRILLCSLALLFSVAVSAQTSKKNKKKKPETEQTDSTSIKSDTTATEKKAEEKTDPQGDDKKSTNKKDYKKANKESKTKNTSTVNTKTSTGKSTEKKTTGTTKKAPQKKMTAAEKKEYERDSIEREALIPKGIEADFYKFPAENLPIVQEFIEVKKAASPNARIKDDPFLRKQIIRFKNIDKGYLELQKPGDTKYTRMQLFKKANNDRVMVVEENDCHPYCLGGTLKFYTYTAGKWKDVTTEYFPQVDNKYMLSKLKAKYKKEYKDLDLYNAKGYEDNEANIKKGIIYTIAPEDQKILIQEQYLPLTLYEMIWDAKKDKFELKKVDK